VRTSRKEPRHEPDHRCRPRRVRRCLEEKMSTPTGSESAFLHELEFEVREELARAETIEAATEAAEAPIETWLSDPADDQRYEVSLHAVLGAVEAMENGARPSVAAAELRRVRAADRAAGPARSARMFPGLDPVGTGDAALPGQLAAGGQDASEAAGWP